MVTAESDMTNHPRIISNPKVMMGKPVIRGARITVEVVLRRMADGWSTGDILQSYPHITEEDIRAALVSSEASQRWLAGQAAQVKEDIAMGRIAPLDIKRKRS